MILLTEHANRGSCPFCCMGKGLGLGRESSQESPPMERALLLWHRGSAEKSKNPECIPPAWIFLPGLVSSRATPRPRNPLSKGRACAWACSGQRACQRDRVQEARDRRVRHQARKRRRTSNESFSSHPGHELSDAASVHISQVRSRRSSGGDMGASGHGKALPPRRTHQCSLQRR